LGAAIHTDSILRQLRPMKSYGVNAVRTAHNPPASMDGLHAKYGGKFFFCSETSSETSARGFHAGPRLLNTGPNFTPGKCLA
jgi:beta-galactosidase